MKNRAFLRAFHLLTRPLTLGAVGILFLNDHVLRRSWPSWWTGKIGDFAWLYFAPFVAGAILAWLIPAKWRRQELIVGLLSFGLIGSTFTLANSLPAFHRWFTSGVETLLGIPIVIHKDPTDLIALISLWFAWRTWGSCKPPERTSSVAGWASLLAAAFLTIANGMPTPNYSNLGIDCLRIENEVILAHATPIHFYARHDTNFASTDGGLTWIEVDDDPDFECGTFIDYRVIDPTNDQVRYYVYPDQKIELSLDGGATWQNVFTMEPIGQAEETFYRRTRIDPVEIAPVPLDGIIDPATGNAIFAMGHQGVLVHTSAGEWEWVGVGPHVRMDADYIASIPRMLVVEFVLALTFAVLGFVTLSMRNVWNKPFLVVIAITWAVWMFSTINFAPGGLVRSVRFDVAELICSAMIMVLFGMSVLYSLVNIVPMLKDHRGSLVRLAFVALLGGLAYLLPYVFWMLNILSTYSIVSIIALVSAIAVLVAGDLWHRAYLRTLPVVGNESSEASGESDVQ